jgi:hypothetical protein
MRNPGLKPCAVLFSHFAAITSPTCRPFRPFAHSPNPDERELVPTGGPTKLTPLSTFSIFRNRQSTPFFL